MSRKPTPLLTKTEVADYLRVSVRSVERFIESGDLAAHGIGGKTRIHPDDLAAYLRAARRPIDPKQQQ